MCEELVGKGGHDDLAHDGGSAFGPDCRECGCGEFQSFEAVVAEAVRNESSLLVRRPGAGTYMPFRQGRRVVMQTVKHHVRVEPGGDAGSRDDDCGLKSVAMEPGIGPDFDVRSSFGYFGNRPPATRRDFKESRIGQWRQAVAVFREVLGQGHHASRSSDEEMISLV